MIPEGALRIHESAHRLFESVADMLVGAIRSSLEERGTCILGLSGGGTPGPIYRRLGLPPRKGRVDWEKVHLIFDDERMVSPQDPRSNFAMVDRELLSRISIPPENVHRIRGEGEPVSAARDYEQELRGLLARSSGRIDCILLGLGEDGHTASLFPGSPALQEGISLTQAVYLPREGIWRVTVTLPLINAARRVFFVVTGRRKAEIMARLARAAEPSVLLPSLLVQPADGELIWMIDREASSQLWKS